MRRSKKKKPTTSQIEAYVEFLKKLDKLHPNFASRSPSKALPRQKAIMMLKPPPGREFYTANSSPSSFSGSTGKKESPLYTGSAMKGIGTMHKSNSVPVFSSEEAIEIATMRRN
jgi:hypothetical protein